MSKAESARRILMLHTFRHKIEDNGVDKGLDRRGRQDILSHRLTGKKACMRGLKLRVYEARKDADEEGGHAFL